MLKKISIPLNILIIMAVFAWLFSAGVFAADTAGTEAAGSYSLPGLHESAASLHISGYKHDPMVNPKAAADIIEDPAAVYGYRPNPESVRLGVYADYDWTDPVVVGEMRKQREEYHESLKELYTIISDMKAAGKSVEEIARAVSTRRNEIRMEQCKTEEELEKLKESNLKTYGNEMGGTPDYFYKKYGSWETVIEKSLSTNAGADACLGLYDIYYDTYIFDCTHKWASAYTTDRAPTCTQEGLESIHCVECGQIKPDSTRTIPRLTAVSSISISGISKKIAAGKKLQLQAKVLPANAVNKELTWTSSDSGIAAVDQKGKVTIKKKTGGKTVTITASAKDGSGVKESWKIKVMKGAVSKIKIRGGKSVKAGKTLKLKAVVETGKGKPVNKTLKWTSSDDSRATVTRAGKVKAFKAGKGKTVLITASATDGSGKKKTVKIKIQ